MEPKEKAKIKNFDYKSEMRNNNNKRCPKVEKEKPNT
jgi:hypothetical protein